MAVEPRARTCVLVLCGLPGAGKSTLTAALASHPPRLTAASPVHVSCVSFDQVEYPADSSHAAGPRPPLFASSATRPHSPREHAAWSRWSGSLRSDHTGRELRRKRPRSIHSCGRYDTRHPPSKPPQALLLPSSSSRRRSHPN